MEYLFELWQIGNIQFVLEIWSKRFILGSFWHTFPQVYKSLYISSTTWMLPISNVPILFVMKNYIVFIHGVRTNSSPSWRYVEKTCSSSIMYTLQKFHVRIPLSNLEYSTLGGCFFKVRGVWVKKGHMHYTWVEYTEKSAMVRSSIPACVLYRNCL